MHTCDEHCLHPPLPPDRKHLLALIDGNAAHRAEAAKALLSFYHVVEYADSSRAIAQLRITEPGILVIGEHAPPHGGLELIRQLRTGGKYARTPVLMLLERDAPETHTEAKAAGASATLAKPYRRSTLINAISNLLNTSLERSWEALPEVQARALKGTVTSFNALADIIANGEPIPYSQVNDACLPIIEAINAHDFKGILNGVKDHDNYTYAHSLRVGTLLALFGHAIGLPAHEQQLLATGGLLHDVGKMAIPHLVLNKPGKLTDDEFTVMKQHVNKSIEYLELGGSIPRGVITIAGQHHEKLDGTGYPLNIQGTQLNELARMAAIVDVFSALTDRRVYKAAMSAEAALAIMTDEMGYHLDQSLLSMFRAVFLDAVGDV